MVSRKAKRKSDAAPGEPTGPDTPEAPAPEKGEAKKKVSPWSRFRENAEAVLVAIILALIIRHFSLEAFEIPTGSMAPRLNGVHVESSCPNCDHVADVGLETDPQSGKVVGGATLWESLGVASTRPRRRGIFAHSGWIYDGPCPDCDSHVEALMQWPYDRDLEFVEVERDGKKIQIGPAIACSVCRVAQQKSLVDGGPAEYYRRVAAYYNFDAWCPLCTHQYKEFVEPTDVVGGHKILVNKFLYEMRDPQRWEVIVFKFNRQRNYIKRLVGLPGERLQIVHGDIWADSGEGPRIQRKPVWAQDQLWHPVHDSHLADRGGAVQPAWREVSGKGWQHDGEARRHSFSTLDAPATLEYERPVLNRYAYNRSKPRHRRVDSIRDLRLEAEIGVSTGSGEVTLEIVNGDNTYICRIPAGREGDAVFEVDGTATKAEETSPAGDQRLPRTLEGVALPANGEPVQVDFYLADRQLVLRIDGEVHVHELDLSIAEHQTYRSGQLNTVRIRTSGIAGHVERFRVFRDIHYTPLTGPENNACGVPYPIPPATQVVLRKDGSEILADVIAEEGGRLKIDVDPGVGETPMEIALEDVVEVASRDGYFAMGDNSPSSLDSRDWGYVPRENMLGRAFITFWPALPWRWEIGFIR